MLFYCDGTAAPIAIITGCYPTFTTESASGLGTNTGQEQALHAFFKLNLPTTVWVIFRTARFDWHSGSFFLPDKPWETQGARRHLQLVQSLVLVQLPANCQHKWSFHTKVNMIHATRSIRKSCRFFYTHWTMERANAMCRSVRLLLLPPMPIYVELTNARRRFMSNVTLG